MRSATASAPSCSRDSIRRCCSPMTLRLRRRPSASASIRRCISSRAMRSRISTMAGSASGRASSVGLRARRRQSRSGAVCRPGPLRSGTAGRRRISPSAAASISASARRSPGSNCRSRCRSCSSACPASASPPRRAIATAIIFTGLEALQPRVVIESREAAGMTDLGSVEDVAAGALDIAYYETRPRRRPAGRAAAWLSYDVHAYGERSRRLAAAGRRCIMP